MSGKATIDYHLPALGHIGGTLHDESALILRSMSKTEIDRLKNVPQLGLVAEAWRGARHTRWEYVVLLVYLIQQCKDVTDLRLNSRVRIDSETWFSSTQELLNSWALLLQTGHLYWTFFSERILLEQLRGQFTLPLPILEATPPGQVQQWARRVLDDGMYYQFHILLAYYRLPKTVRSKPSRALARKVLNAYVAPDGYESLRYARSLFGRIRRIAFLALDAEYSPSSVGLRLGRVLRDKRTLERILTPVGRGEDELSGLESYLSMQVYLGREVLIEAARREKQLRSRIEPALSNNDLASAVGELATHKSGLIAGSSRDPLMEAVVRLEVDMRWGLFDQPDVFNCAAQRQRAYGWASRKKTGFHLAYETDATRQFVVAQLHSQSTDVMSRSAAIAYAFKFLSQLVSEDDLKQNEASSRFHYRLANQILGEPIRELLVSSLGVMFDDDLRWEWGEPVGGYSAVFIPTARDSGLVAELVNLEGLGRARRNEVESTRRATFGLSQGPLIMSVSGLRAFKSERRTPFLEVDGIVLSRDRLRREIVVTVIEAKMQRKRGESDARHDLSEKTRKLQRSPTAIRGNVRSYSNKRQACAWRHFRLGYSSS